MIRAMHAGVWTAALLLSGGAFAAQEPSPEVRREEQHWQQKQQREAEKDMRSAQDIEPEQKEGFELSRLGSEDVRKVQQTLAEQGFYRGPVDGEATPATIAALGAFQSKHQIPASGQLDAGTAEKLGLKVASLERTEVRPTTARLEATDLAKLSRDEVIEIQRHLTEKGLFRGEVDGRVTPALTAALGAFQAQQQLAVTGRLDRETAGALGMRAGVRGEQFLEFGDLTPEQRMQVQRSLKQSGFYQGEIDGRFGPGTQQALRRLQQQNQLPVTGRLDYESAQLLGLEGVQEMQPVRGVEEPPPQQQAPPVNDQMQQQPPTPEQERQGGTPQGQPEGR